MMSRPWDVIEVISCTKESLNKSVRLPESRALNASAPTPPLPKSDQIWVSSFTAGKPVRLGKPGSTRKKSPPTVIPKKFGATRR
jgi:hypothetical protein